MNKCEWCKYSRPTKYGFECPYFACILTQSDIEDILKVLSKIKNKQLR